MHIREIGTTLATSQFWNKRVKFSGKFETIILMKLET